MFFSITCTKSTQYFKTCPLLDMPRPPSLTEMASRRGLQIFQFNTKKRLDSFHYIFIPFHPFFPSICLYLLHNYQSSVQASSCRPAGLHHVVHWGGVKNIKVEKCKWLGKIRNYDWNIRLARFWANLYYIFTLYYKGKMATMSPKINKIETLPKSRPKVINSWNLSRREHILGMFEL